MAPLDDFRRSRKPPPAGPCGAGHDPSLKPLKSQKSSAEILFKQQAIQPPMNTDKGMIKNQYKYQSSFSLSAFHRCSSVFIGG